MVVHALLDGRDTPPRSAVGVRAGPRDRGSPRRIRRAHRDGRRPLLRRWTATNAGIASSTATTRSSTARGRHAPTARTASRRRTRAARPTSSSRRPSSTASTAPVRDGDAVIHFNFRADRARQLTHALADGDVRRLRPRRRRPPRPARRDDDRVRGRPARARSLSRPWWSAVARRASRAAGWRQFHVAETEKYAHVTYFFNGGVEEPLPGEERVLVPSPEGRDLRPAARDERRGRHRRAVRGDRVGRLRLHRRQLRQPRHGRPHRRLGRGGRGRRVRRRCLGRVVVAWRPPMPCPAAPGALLPSRPTTATPTRCATKLASR